MNHGTYEKLEILTTEHTELHGKGFCSVVLDTETQSCKSCKSWLKILTTKHAKLHGKEVLFRGSGH
jgi:formate dehydrogenase maturation protein FdhE